MIPPQKKTFAAVCCLADEIRSQYSQGRKFSFWLKCFLAVNLEIFRLFSGDKFPLFVCNVAVADTDGYYNLPLCKNWNQEV